MTVSVAAVATDVSGTAARRSGTDSIPTAETLK
jgi:hypothetical protein